MSSISPSPPQTHYLNATGYSTFLYRQNTEVLILFSNSCGHLRCANSSARGTGCHCTLSQDNRTEEFTFQIPFKKYHNWLINSTQPNATKLRHKPILYMHSYQIYMCIDSYLHLFFSTSCAILKYIMFSIGITHLAPACSM